MEGSLFCFKTTTVCLVMAVGLTQDLALILLTKNTKQNKTNKQQELPEANHRARRSAQGKI